MLLSFLADFSEMTLGMLLVALFVVTANVGFLGFLAGDLGGCLHGSIHYLVLDLATGLNDGSAHLFRSCLAFSLDCSLEFNERINLLLSSGFDLIALTEGEHEREAHNHDGDNLVGFAYHLIDLQNLI